MVFRSYKEQYRQNLRLAAPVVLSQVGQVTVQLFDNAMVGRLGKLPLAAVSFGGTVFFMFFTLFMGLSMGLTPLIGEHYSKGKFRVSGAYLQNSLMLYTLIAVIAMIIQFAAMPLMYKLGQPHEVVTMAIPYYKYLLWSLLPFMIFASFKQFLEGVGNTTANMVIIISANIINVIFNYLLIYGKFGFPEMGAAGAGLATLISRICMPVFAILYFFIKVKYKRYFKYFSRENITWVWNRGLLSVGMPIAIQMFLEGGAFALSSIMMGWISTTAIAANQIALIISNFAFMVVVGIGAATTIRVSHEFGTGNMRMLKKAANASYHIGLAWNTITALAFILLRDYIPRIFTDDPEVLALASQLMIFTAAFQFSDGLQHISLGILRGMQDVKPIIWIAFFSYIVINLPVGYLCAFVLNWGAGGLWIGFIFGLSVAAILLITRFRKQYVRIRKESMRI